jgi:hypothetical protein
MLALSALPIIVAVIAPLAGADIGRGEWISAGTFLSALSWLAALAWLGYRWWARRRAPDLVAA